MAMAAAWHGAVIARASSIPPLSDLLGDDREAQTDDDMTFNLQAWSAATQGSPTSPEG